MTHSPQSRSVFRENIGGNGSPIAGRIHTKSNLFVVNPSNTPGHSPVVYQGNQVDTKGFSKLGGNTTVRDVGMGEEGQSQTRRGPGYRASSGVFPAGFQVPTPQSTIAATDNALNSNSPAVQPKRSLFGWSKQAPPTNVRSLGISGPIMTVETQDSSQSFAKIATIDLATAAANERERREGAVARARLLIADRPAPLPPLAAQEALRRSISVKRKEMPSQPFDPMPTIAGSDTSGRSVNGVSGSTTSASLSPGRDEVRRRSPRNANSFGQPDPKLAPQRKPSAGLPSNPRATRINIKKGLDTVEQPTVMLMNDIIYNDPGVVKTIIEGAPSMYAQRPRTAGSSPNSYTTSLKSSGSILHRPRPCSRKAGRDSSIFFGPEQSPRHKRTKSGSSITSRKSLFMSMPGSPTQLPPLPPPPTSAANLKRLLPNTSKSMTFDEKIEMLFPAPPGATMKHHRRSSVPSLPRVPSVFISDTPQVQSPTEETQQSSRESKRTTIASFGLNDSHIPDIDRADISSQPSKSQNTFQYSADIYRTLADDIGNTWIPGVTSDTIDNRNSLQTNTMQNSRPYDTRKSNMTDETSSEIGSHYTTTDWGSIHSQIPAIDLSKATVNASSIQIRDIRKQDVVSRPLPPLPHLPSKNVEVRKEIMTVMMDANEHTRSIPSSSDIQKSFPLDDEAKTGNSSLVFTNVPSWHRRIGDELPTFSERKQSIRNRKMPPPTPLLLNQTGRNASVIVRAPEPSPLDSPGRAIREIQAQLKRFEEPGRESVGSLLQQIPDASDASNSVNDINKGRFELLANLEREMGLQENQWQRMQINMDRDSISSVISPLVPVEPTMSRELSQKSSQSSTRGVSRRARIRESTTGSTNSISTTSTQSSENSTVSAWQQRLAEAQLQYVENAPALLRKRSINFFSIVKGQIGSPTPPDSFDSETDLETESEPESDEDNISPDSVMPVKTANLWGEISHAPEAVTGGLWNPPSQKATPSTSLEPPAKNSRPAQRIIRQPLQILTTSLWTKTSSSPTNRPFDGLWGSKQVRPQSTAARRVTQRPQRKSKRVTFLPDIGRSFIKYCRSQANTSNKVESPLPLPNKKDTLGIFQFPWGEKSDSADYEPAFTPAILSGPVINSNLEARSRELEPESEYSSSFFDDYDDEDFEDSESDDDFDETTLWDIASMLKSSEIPSKNSLLPPVRDIIDDYDEDTDFESDTEQVTITPLPIHHMSALPIQPLNSQALNSQLWDSNLASTVKVANSGLAQPASSVWEQYSTGPSRDVRSKSYISEDLPKITTKDLWASSTPDSEDTTVNIMWSGTTVARETPILNSGSPSKRNVMMWMQAPVKVDSELEGLFSTSHDRSSFRTTMASQVGKDMIRTPRVSTDATLSISSKNLWTPEEASTASPIWMSRSATILTTASPGMWSPVKIIKVIIEKGLFSTGTGRSIFRTTDESPAAIKMTSKSQALRTPLAQLTSTHLWSRQEIPEAEHHWISESSIRPESPSIYSTSSSGRSSPASESSSPRSTSTKASSIWGSMRFGFRGQSLESKATPSVPSDSNTRDFRSLLRKTSKQHPERLEPVRESQVITSRAAWEAMAPPKLDDTPIKKLRKVSGTQLTSKPISIPVRLKHRPTVAFLANWKEALAEAIALGTLKTSLNRSEASEVEWNAALTEAISLSQPRFARSAYNLESWEAALAEAISLSKPRFQRSIYTLASWDAALDEAISKSTIPTITSTTSYDPAVLHPVFFCRSLISSAQDLHPAAFGYVTREAQPNTAVMWVAATSPKTVPATMWAKTEGKRLSIFGQAGDAKLRKPATKRSFDLPVLESTSFWEPVRALSSERNWLTTKKEVHVQTWAATNIHAEVEEFGVAAMWAASTKTTVPDLFAHIKAGTTKISRSSRPAALPRLSSSKLFKLKAPAKDITHWLHSTSSTTSAFTSPSTISPQMMWTAQQIVSSAAALPVVSSSSSELFAHIKAGSNKRTKTTRPVALAPLTSGELFVSKATTSKDTHWLHASSSSSNSMAPKISNPAEPINSTFEMPGRLMWAPTNTSLPLNPAVTVALFDMFGHIKSEQVKRSTRCRPAPLSQLQSRGLFEVQPDLAETMHWLHNTSMKSRLEGSRASNTKESKSIMWSCTSQTLLPTQAFTVASTDMFGHIKSGQVKKSTRSYVAGLSRLSSHELFEVKPTSMEPTHWLQAASAQASPKPSLTMWTAPLNDTALSTRNNFTVASPSSPEIFSHVKAEQNTRKATRPVTLTHLDSSDLFENTMKAGKDTNWLEEYSR
jgi:hypothetical protein